MAIHMACSVGFTQGVGELCKLGADVNITNNSGNSGLHIAAVNGHSGCIAALLGNGAKINTINKAGQTPSDLALQSGHKDMAVLLQREPTFTLRKGLAAKTQIEMENTNSDDTTSEQENIITSEDTFSPSPELRRLHPQLHRETSTPSLPTRRITTAPGVATLRGTPIPQRASYYQTSTLRAVKPPPEFKALPVLPKRNTPSLNSSAAPITRTNSLGVVTRSSVFKRKIRHHEVKILPQLFHCQQGRSLQHLLVIGAPATNLVDQHLFRLIHVILVITLLLDPFPQKS
eukprot:TRINITY_DN6853_c0_g1_i1.p1 TRINITY_DN6853_c0_g1~~TRINITY_DN6853_c0_g1_i1.p1  ORF type:complete len:288 (+),score=29.58 TRINITY_DN6853_c0_g1_i1:389-1252(+)